MAVREWKDIRSWEEILNIKELGSLVGIIKELGLKREGLKNPDDMRRIILDHWKQTHGDFALKGDEIRNGLENGLKEQKQVRKTLLEKYQNTEQFFLSLDSTVQRSVEKSFPAYDGKREEIRKSFQERKASLETGECTIVVAGEVGAGKSSFINLLLGSQLFPTDPLKCTNTVCEIRVSENGLKEAIVFYKPISKEDGQEIVPSPKKLKLDSLRGIKEFKEHVTEANDDDENPYDRVEVYWPFQMLSKGVVIVDTPGIEGGQNIDQSLTKYLSKAFGFIFMINTTTAGGVQPSRLGHLLKTIVNNANDFDPKASLFIGNKWEFVPDSDKADVKADIFEKLSKLYTGIQPSQIHYMSVTKAMQVSLDHNARIQEHSVLLSKIEQLVPVCLRQGLSANYWWLSSFLRRSEYLLRVFCNTFAQDHGALEAQRSSLKEKVQLLKKNSDECTKRLRDKVEFDIFRISEAVKNYMKSRTFLDRVCDWNDSNECPKSQRRWKTSAYEASIKISTKITQMLDQWEKSNKVLKGIENEIIEVFSRELGLMEDQLEMLEADLMRNKGKELLQTMKSAPVKKLFGRSRQKIKATYSTLGGAISVVGTLDSDKKEVKRVFKDYSDRNKCEKMGEGAVLYVQNILECRNLQERLRKFFAKFFTAIDDAAERIPSFLKADEQLIETINKTIEVERHQREMLPTLASDCGQMLGDLDIFYVNYIMNFDFQLGGDIDFNFADWGLGSGNFADVYKGIMKKNGKEVALKKNRDPVTKQNITDILTEDRIMRDLRHRNIIRYFGSSYKKANQGIQFIMVLEMCKKSLKDVYIDDSSPDALIPGRMPAEHPLRLKAAKKMVNDACQIAEGLDYIHSKGYTHRDMKMENILVGSDNLIKITDVGISKRTDILVRTCAGSPAYMAPEVLLCTQDHTNKLDIYSTAFIFWEMWFGVDIVLDMNKVVLGYNFDGDAMEHLKNKQRSEKGFRPDLKRANRPPDSFVQMLQQGWHTRPEVRPSAKELVQFFKDFEKNNFK